MEFSFPFPKIYDVTTGQNGLCHVNTLVFKYFLIKHIVTDKQSIVLREPLRDENGLCIPCKIGTPGKENHVSFYYDSFV